MNTFVSSVLANKVLNYTLTDSTITLDPIDAATGSNYVSKTYTTGIGALTQSTNYYATSNTGSDGYVATLVDSSTIFVTYNENKSTAAVYTGSASLPSSVKDQYANGTATNALGATYGYGYAVLKTSTGDATVGTASVVFLTTTTGLTASASNYAYVVASDVTVTLASDGSTVYNYAAYKAGDAAGTPSLTLTSSTKLPNGSPNGLYSYTDNNEIGSNVASSSTTTLAADTDLYVYGYLKVLGNQLLVLDSAKGNILYAFNITSDTQSTFLNGLTELDGSHAGFVAVTEKSGKRGSDVAGYYVTDAN
jgi:hypothetical protein